MKVYKLPLLVLATPLNRAVFSSTIPILAAEDTQHGVEAVTNVAIVVQGSRKHSCSAGHSQA